MDEKSSLLTSRWDQLGMFLEDIYSMWHSTNDYLLNNEFELAKDEVKLIEKMVIEVLGIYHEIDSSSNFPERTN